MKIPKRVRIMRNTGDKFYDKYIGEEVDVIERDRDGCDFFILPIPNIHPSIDTTSWHMCELEVLEWAEEDDIDVSDEYSEITISRKEYNELLEYKAMYEGLDR